MIFFTKETIAMRSMREQEECTIEQQSLQLRLHLQLQYCPMKNIESKN
jgi:hypothetical protein